MTCTPKKIRYFVSEYLVDAFSKYHCRLPIHEFVDRETAMLSSFWMQMHMN